MIRAFFSYTHYDTEFAQYLHSEIERAFSNHMKVFIDRDDIESGGEWRPDVLKELEKAHILFVLLTPESRKSDWVLFETGFFLGRFDEIDRKNRVYILQHHQAIIPNPLAEINSTRLERESEIDKLFKTVSENHKIPYATPNTKEIVRRSGQISTRMHERSIAYFERMLEEADWRYVRETSRYLTAAEIWNLIKHGAEHYSPPTDNEVWVCESDVALQIMLDYGSQEPFEAESVRWITRIFEYSYYIEKQGFATRFYINLITYGVCIEKIGFLQLAERILVPIPEQHQLPEGQIEYHWKENSLAYKVAMVIARSSRSLLHGAYRSLDEFAEVAGIKIHKANT